MASGWLLSACKGAAIHVNTQNGFTPPSNLTLQITMTSLLVSSSMGILLHSLYSLGVVHEEKRSSVGPIISSCSIVGGLCTAYISGAINGWNMAYNKPLIDTDNCLRVCCGVGTSIGVITAIRYNKNYI